MKCGVCVPNYGETLSAKGLQEISLECEKLGYDSIWTSDHVLMPQNGPVAYGRVLDSLTTITYLAAVTSKVRLGISSLVLALRNPMIIAKQLISLDILSGGRITLATSAGWCEREFEYLGSNFHDRGRRLDDSIKLIRALWTGKESFRGTSIPQNYENVIFEPKPLQRTLTIWIGGASRAALRRAATLGDGWHPNVFPIEVMKSLVSEFRGMPGGESKPICARLIINIRAKQSAFVTSTGVRQIIVSADDKKNVSIVEDLKSLGVSSFVLAPDPAGNISIQNQIASLQYFAEKFLD
jgi:probable F420-dependent oxidoreductase